MTTTAVAATPTYNWYQTGGVSSYWVRSIVNNATNGVMYAACDGTYPWGQEYGAGVWKYQNGGWSDTGQLSNYTVSGLAMYQKKGILYAAAGSNGVWQYDGNSWTELGPSVPTSADQVVCDPNTGTLYAGMNNSSQSGVWKYEGGNWYDISGALAGYQVEGLAFDPFRNQLYAGAYNHGIWMYDGTNWNDTGGAVSAWGGHRLAYDSDHNLLYDGTQGHGVWKYDGKKGWVDTFVGQDYLVDALFYEHNYNLLYAACYDPASGGKGVAAYDGNGWTNTMGGLQNSIALSIGYDPMTNSYYAGTTTGVFKADLPIIRSATPNTGIQGQTLDVALTGTGTNFQQGVSQATFSGNGINVNYTNVTGPGDAIANITIATGADFGARDVNVVTGSEVPSPLWGGFKVIAPAPNVYSINPNQWNNAYPGQFTIQGAGFSGHKSLYARLTRQGDGDRIGANVSIQNDGQFTCNFDLTGTQPGQWNVVVWYDGSGDGVLPNGLNIVQPGPVVNYVTPKTVTSGGVVDLTDVHGDFFQKGAWIRFKKPGSEMIKALTVTPVSPQQMTCTVDLKGAAVGAWDVVVDNPDGQSGSLPGGLVVEDPRPAVAGVQPSEGTPGTRVTVTGSNFGPGGGSSTVTIGGVPATVVSWSDTTVVVIVPEGAVSGSVVVTTAVGGSNRDHDFVVRELPKSTWYLAEGSTAWGFTTFVTIENPNPGAVTARVTYMVPGNPATGKGGSVSRVVSLPAASQTTLNPADDLHSPTDFSTSVVCLQGKTIAVDRTMTFAGAGAEAIGAHNSIGVNAPARTWYLPEGSSAWGFDCWCLVQNPGGKDANVTLTYMIEGVGPRVVKHKVAAGSRATFNMADDIGAHDASIEVTSDQPVIPERSMYTHATYPGGVTVLREGQCSIGATAPATEYFLAEGSTAWGFETYVLVQNPNNSPNSVTLDALTDGQGVVESTFAMPPRSRRTIPMNEVLRKPADFSVTVRGSLPLVAERSMYWSCAGYPGNGMHDSIGVAGAHKSWYLPAGGTVGSRDAETYTCVANPNDEVVTVKVFYLAPSGKGNAIMTDEIAPHSRKTYRMGAMVSGPAAVAVSSTDGNLPIVVEGSMYLDGKAAGTNTIGAFSD